MFDESDSASTINRAIEAANLSGAPNLAVVRQRIDQAKNEGLRRGFAGSHDIVRNTAAIAEIYRIYQERLRELNAVDFGDLLLLVHGCFITIPRCWSASSARFNYLLVDEYQDTNRVQYLLLRALAAGTRQHLRGRRRRPVDLPLARRGHPQHPRVRAATSPARGWSSWSRTTARPRPSWPPRTP